MAVAAFVISVLLAVVVLIGGAALLIQSGNRADETHEAICALSEDLVSRAASTRRFLDDHPRGIPGIPVATLRESLKNQERSIEALSVVSCS